jgi:hypothetical protein
MTHLRKMMLEELERRNYAQTTIDGYLRAVAEFSLLLPSPSASHTPLYPPSTPVHRLPYATHRRYRKPITTAPDRTAGRLPSSRCIKSDRCRF